MAAFASTLTDRYEASAVIASDATAQGASGNGNISPVLAPPTVDEEIARITNTAIARKVIDKLDLRRDAEFRDDALTHPDNSDAIGRLLDSADTTTSEDAVLGKFASAVSARRVREARLIEVAVSSTDPAKAARIANTIADVYLEQETRASGLARDAIESRIASLRIKVSDAERRAEKLSREALDSAKADLKTVRDEVAAERQILEGLLGQGRKAAQSPPPQSRIVQRASIPAKPASPNRLQMVLLALVGGLVVGFGVASARERSTDRTVGPQSAARALGLVHLSSVPEIAVATGDPAAALKALRMIMAEPSGVFTEAIAAARFEIDMRSTTAVPRMILVASSLPAESSQTIASNLAHQYTALGRRVLLVDCDLRQAKLTRRLAPLAPRGLLDVLVRDLDFENAVLRDATSGLNFLPAMQADPAEVCDPAMLASARMAAVFAFMKRKFDTVIVSAPALLPLPDARMLAEHADQIVFVMAWRKTTTETALRALRCLGASRRKVVGMIVTDTDAAEAARVIKAGSEFGLQVPQRAA